MNTTDTFGIHLNLFGLTANQLLAVSQALASTGYYERYTGSTSDTTGEPCGECEACKPDTVVQVDPGYAPAEEAVTPPRPTEPIDVIMGMLHDDRYRLRTVEAIADELNEVFPALQAEFIDVKYFLDANGIDYVTYTRRSDGAALIGLASRN